MSIGRNFRCGRFAVADRPNRLVGDYDFRKLILCKSTDAASELLCNHRFHSFPFAFSDANDGGESRVERCHGLLQHLIIRFPEKVAAFAVSHDDVGTSGGLDHGAGDLARKGTLVFPVKVLCTDLDP